MTTSAYKIIIAGEGGVGKTTLLFKYINGTFLQDTSMTIGVQFHTKYACYGGNNYNLAIWDLSGQERFRFMLSSYIQGARAAILLYDTTWMGSINNLDEWIKILRKETKDLPILLCGTKIDLVTHRSVSENYARSYLESSNLFDYIEVSAKTGENVEKVFEKTCLKISETCKSQVTEPCPK